MADTVKCHLASVMVGKNNPLGGLLGGNLSVSPMFHPYAKIEHKWD